ncbi:NAD-dependent epimerase/dehydratase family protein [Legionella waltersii]|uniref:UDP-glucose 4-epimerase n=1 Tax=Legionella waltersii TaxID=66969 RepID=A0A0W1ANA2_9GAMM|nr:NAD-dependent epimerase/dehydratase family protein [Legionella waltersii]KTD82738.1 UDP-glucose 4-epimerase [Legionella waltersii]SNV01011.1 UDP-glucose 4-epimerase (Galactowaldenase) (UDP-galactose 4-epimerase) [Legionella waltersii]
MSKILVTGATGFVGKALVPALVHAGHEVTCAVTRKVDWLNTEQYLINRIEDPQDWSNALSGVEVVIHLAARVHIMNDKSLSPIDEYCKVNSEATKALAEQAALCRVKRFIYLSSIKVNGEFTNGTAFTEEVIALPEDPYALSKYYAEQHLQEICQNTGMEYVILRPPLIYGPGVKANFLKMIKLVHKNVPMPFRNVKNRRSFLYLDNLISALCLIVEHEKAANHVFLISDNEALSISQLLKLIATQFQQNPRLFPVPIGLISVFLKLVGLNGVYIRLFSSLELSTNKIKSILSWSPIYTAEEGIARTITWYKIDRAN